MDLSPMGNSCMPTRGERSSGYVPTPKVGSIGDWGLGIADGCFRWHNRVMVLRNEGCGAFGSVHSITASELEPDRLAWRSQKYCEKVS